MTSILNRARNIVLGVKKDSEPETTRIPIIHNFTFSIWGHSISCITQMGEGRISFMGHSRYDIREGDYLLFEDAKDHHTARYRVTEVKCCYDPRDLYSGKAVYERRTEEQFNRDMELVKLKPYKWTD